MLFIQSQEDDLVKIDVNRNRFDFKVLEAADYVVAEFPIRNSFSYVIGPTKVYPAIYKYLKKNGLKSAGPGIEIYDATAKKIYFLMRAEK